MTLRIFTIHQGPSPSWYPSSRFYDLDCKMNTSSKKKQSNHKTHDYDKEDTTTNFTFTIPANKTV